MNNPTTRGPTAAKLNSPEQRTRRKISREVGAMRDDIARAAGFDPGERRAAWAITIRLYERAGEDCETPREISLATIGKSLTSRSDDQEACAQAARRQCGKLFNQAIPRTGFQILTRYKAPEDEEEEKKRPHRYADHLTPIAAFFSELLAEETKAILLTNGLDKKAKRMKIEEARARLVAEAVTWLPRCDAEMITPEGETYAYVSQPEAEEYCKLNPGFQYRPFTYTPPGEEDATARRPLAGADFERLKDRAVKRAIDEILEEIADRNSVEEAQIFWRTELLPTLQRAGSSWVKVATTQSASDAEREEEKQEELIHVSELRPLNNEIGAEEAPDTLWKTTPNEEAVRPDKLSGLTGSNSFADNTEIFESPEIDPVENPPESAPAIVGSINFDESLEAAIFYAKDGWPVLPICNFDPERGRCTARWHPEDCAGKKPLVAGKGEHKPGDGYTAATRDLDRILKWYRGEFRSSGVGLRLDGKALIDADLKDGGPESYAFVRDTFGLPETLTQATQGGGGHYVFSLLPESEELLKSWTRVLDKIALPGIDLKVGKCGLLYAEPTRGRKGVYRWVDPTIEPAVLPHEAAEFFNTIRHIETPEQRARAARASAFTSSSEPRRFDSDQSKFFRDVPAGQRHTRLLAIGTAIRREHRLGADQIAEAMRYHAARFSDPLNDEAWIRRTATSIERRF